MTAIGVAERGRTTAVYVLVVIVGLGAFLYPFWLPADALPDSAHSADAPLLAALIGGLAVAAVTLEVRRGTVNGATIALLGMISALAGFMKLLDLPGGGSGLFFLVILAGAAFGPRFGLLLGFTSFVVSAVLSGGIGPWLPFQMLALAGMGASAGFIGQATARLRPVAEVAVLAAFGWVWGFVFGAIMNLWFWPFQQGTGPLEWNPELSLGETLQHYWSFYVATSLPWDAAGALANAAIILAVGLPLLRTMRRYAHRLAPVTDLVPAADGVLVPDLVQPPTSPST